jgi:hypothetical protein
MALFSAVQTIYKFPRKTMNTVATTNSLVSAGAASFVSISTSEAIDVLNSLVVFDSRLSDLAVLYGALLPNAIGHTIDTTEDALVVITRLLAETGAKSLAIVAHGEPGMIHLGRESIDLGVLGARSGLFQEWCLDEISLYSCEVGASAEFVQQLAVVTGAAVFAADTKVGAGNWDLTVKSGSKDMTVPWSIADVMSYAETLAPGHNVNASLSTDIFTGLGGVFDLGDTTSDDDVITVETNQIQATDVFEGGSGTDTIFVQNGTGSYDFTSATISNIENLISGLNNQTITITAAQFAHLTAINMGGGTGDVLNIKVSGAALVTS